MAPGFTHTLVNFITAFCCSETVNVGCNYDLLLVITNSQALYYSILHSFHCHNRSTAQDNRTKRSFSMTVLLVFKVVLRPKKNFFFPLDFKTMLIKR